MSPIKPTLKTEIASLLMIVIGFILSFYFYANFPEQVPTHWNIQGQVDGWSSAGFAAFFFPFLVLGLYLLFLVIPYLDPKKDRYKEFRTTYHLFKGVIVAFMFVIYLVVGFSGMGYDLDISIIVSSMVAILFLLIGSQMPKIKSNWFLGIRTPWTLSSEKVWQKTHVFGSKTFLIAGLLLFIAGILDGTASLILFIASILLAVLAPIVYSYMEFRRVGK